jgi:hypothetical protein
MGVRLRTTLTATAAVAAALCLAAIALFAALDSSLSDSTRELALKDAQARAAARGFLQVNSGVVGGAGLDAKPGAGIPDTKAGTATTDPKPGTATTGARPGTAAPDAESGAGTPGPLPGARPDSAPLPPPGVGKDPGLPEAPAGKGVDEELARAMRSTSPRRASTASWWSPRCTRPGTARSRSRAPPRWNPPGRPCAP